MRCEARVVRDGQPLNIEFQVPDGTDATTPAGRQAIEAAAQAAVQQRFLNSGVVNIDVRYDIYVDTSRGGGVTDNGDTIIYRNGDNSAHVAIASGTTTRPATGSPLTYRVAWARDQILRAKAMTPDTIDTDPAEEGVQTMSPGLTGLTYQTDGQTGPLSQEEARSFIRSFEGLFTDNDTDRARLRHIYSQNPSFDLGPDGNHRLMDIYTAAGLQPAGSIARSETSAPGATVPGGDQASAVNDFIRNQSMENLQKLNRERLKADQLIAMYLAALESGNLDVLTTVMDLVAMKSNLTVAEIAARTARILGQNDEQAQRIGRDLAAVNMGATDAATRGRAQQTVQQLQIELQQNTSARQQIVSMLQTAMGAAEDIRSENRAIREKKGAMDRAAQPR